MEQSKEPQDADAVISCAITPMSKAASRPSCIPDEDLSKLTSRCQPRRTEGLRANAPRGRVLAGIGAPPPSAERPRLLHNATGGIQPGTKLYRMFDELQCDPHEQGYGSV